MTNSLTLVTFFISLHDYEKTRRPSDEAYLMKFNYIASLDIPLIVYIDSRYKNKVEQIINKYPVKSPREIKVISLSDLYYYDSLDEISKLSLPINAIPYNRDTHVYSMITGCKLDLVSKVAKENPFNTSHIAWIDFGICHAIAIHDIDWNEIFENLTDKIQLTIMKGVGMKEIRNLNEFYSYHRGKICSGFIGGPIDKMIHFERIFDFEFRKSIKLDYAINEEQALSVIYAKNPRLFDVSYGDYTSIFTNFVYLKIDTETILNNLIYCRENGYFDMAAEIVLKLLKSMREKHTKPLYLASQHLLLLDEGLYVSYFTDINLSKYLASIINILYHNTRYIYDELNGKNLQRIKGNMKVVGVDLGIKNNFQKFIESDDAMTWRILL